MTKRKHAHPDYWKTLTPTVDKDDYQSLIHLVEEYWPKCHVSNMKIKYPQDYVNLLHCTDFLPEDAKISNRLFHIVNGKFIPVCVECGAEHFCWINGKQRYSDFCGKKCSGPTRLKKAKETMMDKYGVPNMFLHKETLEKIKETNVERYGVDNPLKSKEIRNKMKQTNVDRYGVECPLEDPEIQEKRRRTCMVNWGTEYYTQTVEFAEIRNGLNQTDDEDFKNKVKQGIFQKFDGYYPGQLPYIENGVISKVSDKDWLYDQHITQQKPLVQLKRELYGYSESSILIWMDRHNIPLNIYRHYEQNNFRDFLDSNDIHYVENNRKIIKPKELDFYLPEYNVAIEYCGIYWHCEREIPDKNYHKFKYEKCKELGIRLITIFSDEWLEHKELVERNILNILKFNKINSNETYVKVLTNVTERDSFYKTYDIDGSPPMKTIDIGLYFNEELVELMSFNECKDKIQLVRYCSSRSVDGGFCKLLNYFTENYNFEKIATVVDLRWSDGKVFYENGFVLDKILKPDYSYMKKHSRYNKVEFKHKKLRRILKDFDYSLTEHQNCFNHGFYRIYDCGKLKLILCKNAEQ